MKSGRTVYRQIAAVICLFLVTPLECWGFYDWQGEENAASLRGFASLSGAIRRNPGNSIFFNDKADTAWDGNLRLLADGMVGSDWHLELNALQLVRSIPESAFARQSGVPLSVERSSVLTWLQHRSNNSEGRFVIDTVSASLSTRHADFTIGRQPINLATTFYFTPNDFFAPFAAQEFFRVYKPGVDAARAEIRLGNLSELSLIGVLGYEPDPSTDNGWSEEPDLSRISLLARIATAKGDFEWAALGGTVRDNTIIGGSIQGELWDWLGIRAEGHYADAENERGTSAGEATLGLEHKFPNSLTVRFEQFYHGKGFSDINGVNDALATGQLDVSYLGKHYSAFGAGYEFSPLLTGDVLLLNNWSDHSQLFSFNAVYSLSDESEVNFNFSLPFGDTPQGTAIKSEFGAAPIQGFMEYRIYF